MVHPSDEMLRTENERLRERVAELEGQLQRLRKFVIWLVIGMSNFTDMWRIALWQPTLLKKLLSSIPRNDPTLLEPLLQHCRAFYVGEHQGHRPCRQPLPCHLLSPPFNRTPLMPMRLHFIPPPLAFPLGVEGWRSFPRFRPQGAEDFPPPLAHRQDGASWRWIPSAQPLL